MKRDFEKVSSVIASCGSDSHKEAALRMIWLFKAKYDLSHDHYLIEALRWALYTKMKDYA